MKESVALFVLAVISISSVAHADLKISITRKACKDLGFEQGVWKQLIAMEPRFKLQFDSMAASIKKLTDENLTIDTLTNCTVEYPVDENGYGVSGYRVVIMDKTWYGNEGKDEYKGGLKIIYYLTYDLIGTDRETRKRDLVGHTICKDVVSCNILGVPVKLPPADPNRPNERPVAAPTIPMPPPVTDKRGSNIPL